MSARAMRKLQGNPLLLGKEGHESDLDNDKNENLEDDDDDEEDEYNDHKPSSRSAFAILPSDSESSSEEEQESEMNQGMDTNENDKNDDTLAQPAIPSSSSPALQETYKEAAKEPLGKKEEDLDAILDEFKEQDQKHCAEQLKDEDGDYVSSANLFRIILQNLDTRELDADWSMRNALAATTDDNTAMVGSKKPATKSTTTTRRNTKTFLFGSPPAVANQASRNYRPPNYVGGGVGMLSYVEEVEDDDVDNPNSCAIPWPYKNTTTPGDWYRFQQADSYMRDLEDYRYIQQTGDLNSLLLFVAHHPFVAQALLQVSTVLYQTPNQGPAAMSFLRRCLYVYECACLVRFHPILLSGKTCLIDHQLEENSTFFQALQRLVHVSSIAGLWRTCLAVSRYILALDPWRDPMNVLAVMDSYALCCYSEIVDQWIIDMVESKDLIRILIPSDNSQETEPRYECALSAMPNWAYSYALALFRVHGGEDGGRATVALQQAMRAFPSVVALLLEAVDVDTTGRSMRRDWLTVLDKGTARHVRLRNTYLSSQDDIIVATATLQAVDNLIRIFCKLSAKAWGDDEVLQFLYDNFEIVVNQDTHGEGDMIPLLNPAVMRYTRVSFSDWEPRIQQLPEDANIVDPGLVAQAQVIEPNRPRLLRRMQAQPGAPRFEQLLAAGGGRGPLQQHGFAGPPTGIVDPDLPLVEVFWRSFLPWNHVEGVRRDPG